MGIEPPDTLLGLYEGTPLTERQWAHGNVLPDKITLFQLPIEDASDDEDDVVVAIGETLIHEIGHYFGLSEEEIEEIEEQYWRGGSDKVPINFGLGHAFSKHFVGTGKGVLTATTRAPSRRTTTSSTSESRRPRAAATSR